MACGLVAAAAASLLLSEGAIERSAAATSSMLWVQPAAEEAPAPQEILAEPIAPVSTEEREAIQRLVDEMRRLDRQDEAWAGSHGSSSARSTDGLGVASDVLSKEALNNLTRDWRWSQGEIDRVTRNMQAALDGIPPGEPSAYLNWTYYPKRLKPVPMPFPSPNKPLVFFHIPKCAGSTLEKHFFKVALAIKVSYVKPCPYSGRPTAFSSVGYGHYPRGFKPLADPLSCGKAESDGCAAAAAGAAAAGALDVAALENSVLRVSLACASMVIGHFTPNLLFNLLATQRYIRERGNKWAVGGSQGKRGAEEAAKACAHAGDEAFCERDFLPEADTGRMKSPMFNCITSVREPLARTLSHYYHFSWEKQRNGELRCSQWSCRHFHNLTLKEQRQVIQFAGHNTQLAWLTLHIMSSQAGWIGRTIGEWVSAGMEILQHCALAIVERWDDTRALFAKMMPWAQELDTQVHLVPHASTGSKRNRSRDPKGYDQELPLLQAAMPMICLSLAPEVFFYVEAVQLFRRRQREFNLTSAGPEHHICERVYRRAGLSRSSLVTKAMV